MLGAVSDYDGDLIVACERPGVVSMFSNVGEIGGSDMSSVASSRIYWQHSRSGTREDAERKYSPLWANTESQRVCETICICGRIYKSLYLFTIFTYLPAQFPESQVIGMTCFNNIVSILIWRISIIRFTIAT